MMTTSQRHNPREGQPDRITGTVRGQARCRSIDAPVARGAGEWFIGTGSRIEIRTCGNPGTPSHSEAECVFLCGPSP